VSHLLPRALVAGLTAVAVLPAAASAAASPVPSPSGCGTTTTTKAFAAFQDQADYSLAPGGDFEHGSAGWSLLNAAIVSGNETAGVGAGGTHSLLLGASPLGGAVMAVSPEFCITADNPTFRYVIKSNTAAPVASGLLTTIAYRTSLSPWVTVETSTIGLQPSRSWVPSAVSPLATRIPAAAFAIPGGVHVRLSFLALPTTAMNGGLQIDDLMVDPYRRS
jgi:hypothetical protein